MRRVMTTLVFAGAIAFAAPCAIFAQRGGGGHAGGGFSGGHAGGFSGGHAGGGFSGGHAGGGFSGGHAGGFSGGRVGGFSGGGFATPRVTAPSGAFAPRSFPAPRMNVMPRPVSPGPTRPNANLRFYGGWKYGQPGNAPVQRPPYSTGNRGGATQPYYPGNWRGGGDHKGGHNGGHDGHYRPPYNGGVNIYSWPYYGWPYYAYGWNWPWIPYLGGWGFSDDYSMDNSAPYTQAPEQYPDQNYRPDPPDEDTARPAYRPSIVTSPGAAVAEPTVTIVYKDGHAEQVHNYALTPTRLLLMDNASAGFSLQIPLALVDLPATARANRASGVDFRVPVEN